MPQRNPEGLKGPFQPSVFVSLFYFSREHGAGRGSIKINVRRGADLSRREAEGQRAIGQRVFEAIDLRGGHTGAVILVTPPLLSS